MNRRKEMSVLRRISDIVSANVNSALDKMENPEKMIVLSIRELEAAILKMRTDLREKSSESRENDSLIKELKDAIERWRKRAELAAEKDEDDMAREALLEKRETEEKLKTAEENKRILENIIGATKENLADAEEKLKEMKESASALKARARLAKDRMEVNKAASKNSNADYIRRLEEMKMKIEKWESLADISQNDIKSDGQKSFEELERENEIEKELEELKRGIKANEKK